MYFLNSHTTKYFFVKKLRVYEPRHAASNKEECVGLHGGVQVGRSQEKRARVTVRSKIIYLKH